MSLIQPLLKGLAQPLLIPTTGLPADYWDAVAALGEKWSLNGSLIGSNGTPVTFTRASQKIYQDSQGKWRSYAVDTPAYGVGLSLEGQSSTKTTGLNDGSTASGVTRSSGDGEDALAVSIATAKSEGVDFSDIQPLVDSSDLLGVVELDCSSATINTAYDLDGAVGNTNPFTISIFGAVTNGLSANFGLSSLLIGSTPVSGLHFSRFYSANISASLASDESRIVVPAGCKAYIALWNTNEEEILTSPIKGAAATRALDDAQISTTGMPVQDCAYYIELPRGIRDVGFNPYVLDSYIDANNFTRLIHAEGASEMVFRKRVAGVQYDARIAYSGGPAAFLLANDSLGGVSITSSEGEADTNTNTLDFQLGATWQFGSSNDGANTNPIFDEEAKFKYFYTSDISLEAAALA